MEHNSIFDKQFGQAVADGQINSIAEAREYAAGWWRNLLAMKSETCEDWKAGYDRLKLENDQNAALAKAYADEVQGLRKLFVGAIDKRDILKAEKELFEEENTKLICEGAKVMHECDRLKLENAELVKDFADEAAGLRTLFARAMDMRDALKLQNTELVEALKKCYPRATKKDYEHARALLARHAPANSLTNP